MNSFVLDASAILAVLNDEEGAETVIDALSAANTVVSAVNYSEVVAKLSAGGMPPDAVDAVINALGLSIVPFDAQTAKGAGQLSPLTGKAGLSFGDRACLALSKQTGIPALTADKAWAALKFHPKIRLIR